MILPELKNKTVFPFVAVFGQDISLFESIADIMEDRLGSICKRSAIFNFSHTDYYTKEMGPDLKKMFFVFEIPVSPERLLDIKLYTIKLEARFSIREGRVKKRKINLDPGYISLNKVVLATHKDFSHRLYLGKGIYGEVTLFFKNKTFVPFPWTYPDYRTPEYINFFNDVRELCYNRYKKEA